MKETLSLIAIIIVSTIIYYATPNKEVETIRIGLNDWPGYEFLYLAKELRLYEEEGVNIEIVQYTSLEDTRFGFEQGQIDIMASTIIEMLLSANRIENKLETFLITDFSNGSDAVIATKTVKNIADIKGKKIAVEPESLGLFMLEKLLTQTGIARDEVEIIGMSQSNQREAIRKGEIDISISYPPFSIDILREVSGTHVIFDSSFIPGEVIDILVAKEEHIEKNLNKYKAIVRAWDKALKFKEENPKRAIEIMSEREKITPEEFKNALEGVVILNSQQQLDYIENKKTVKNSINTAIYILSTSGHISEKFNPDNMVNTRPLRKAYEP
tara:strand:+ start:74382 stop:75362 length:981 start_codon:yes stop_codon:yes gene_type:complete